MRVCKIKLKVNSVIIVFLLNWLNIWFDYRIVYVRLMFRDLVIVEDVVVVVILMEFIM